MKETKPNLGYIVLYNEKGIELARLRYSVPKRPQIIKHWKETFSKFNQYYYHIIPDINSDYDYETANTPSGKNRRINGAGVRS